MANCEEIINKVGSKLSHRITINFSDSQENKERLCGFHLTRSKWDPYPWISYIEAESIADISGLCVGDCLLKIDNIDIVGLRVKDISSLIKKDQGITTTISLQVWRNNKYSSELDSEGAAVSGPLPILARKLATALSGTIKALECPVCLETATSPAAQCVHGHILCVDCRTKTPRCPVCRVRLGQGRCLLADEVQRNIRDAFEESFGSAAECLNNSSLREKLFGKTVNRAKNNNQYKLNKQNSNSIVANTKPKSSLARLLFGGFDKAASVDNLLASNESKTKNYVDQELQPTSYRRLGELFHGDRTKSASTGELSADQQKASSSSSLLFQRSSTIEKVYKSSSGHLSVPQTPGWGGSTESIMYNSFLCPVASSRNCRVPVTNDSYAEHLGKDHSVIQIHFYGFFATIPISSVFRGDCIYVFHQLSDLFFLQIKDKVASIIGTGSNDWYIHCWCSNGSEIKFKKSVSKIDDTNQLLQSRRCYMASLSFALEVDFISVKIVYNESENFNL